MREVSNPRCEADLGVAKIKCRAPAKIAECIFYQLLQLDNQSLDDKNFWLVSCSTRLVIKSLSEKHERT